jgi:hypothetical protein
MDIDDFLDKEKPKPSSEPKEAQADPPKGDLYTQIESIRSLMLEKKFEAAEKRYVEVREQFNQWMKTKTEEQNKLYNALVGINRDMVTGLNQLKEETEKNIGRVYELLGRVQDYVNQGKIDLAQQLFTETESIYNGMASIIPDKKMKLEHDMAGVRVALNSRLGMVAASDFQAKFKNIHAMLTYAFELIKRGQVVEAGAMYTKINELYDTLPSGFLYEKALLYQQILRLHQAVGHVTPAAPDRVLK